MKEKQVPPGNNAEDYIAPNGYLICGVCKSDIAFNLEDGIQVCIHCGKVITDYSGGGWVSSDDKALKGYNRGPVWVTGVNPVSTQAYKPEENYGNDDPYIRKIIKCTQQ